MECPAQPAPPVAFRPGDPFPCPETRASGGHAVKRPGTGPRFLLRMPPGSESRDPLAAALEIARDHTGAPLSSPVGRDHPPTAFPIGSQGSGQRAPASYPEDLGSCRHRSPGSPAAGGGVPRPTEPAVVSPDLHRVGPPEDPAPRCGSLALDSAPDGLSVRNPRGCHPPTVHFTKRGGSPLGSLARRCFMLGSPGVAAAETLCLPRFETRPA
mgnify:CR=1 FL=1